MGLIICGMNGSGKSTLGRALAEQLDWRFIDNEDLYFPKTDPKRPYAAERTRDEVERLLLAEVRRNDQFVFASVRGNYGVDVLSYYQAAVLVEVPREIRLQRVKARSYAKFGERMMPGGDLYESEKRFYELIDARPDGYASCWLEGMEMPVLRVDGTRPVGENVALIAQWLRRHHP